MMHENGWKKDLEIKQLKEQNEILNERLKACETALDETSQKIADADCPAIKPSGNKALREQTEKSIQDRFNSMQIISKTWLMRNLTKIALNNGNRILSYASATAVDDNTRTSENTIREAIR